MNRIENTDGHKYKNVIEDKLMNHHFLRKIYKQ